MGLILVKVLGPGFYSRQDIKTPVKVAIFVLICTQIMNVIFIGPFKHAGLALSIGLGACINACGLYYFLVKKKFYVTESLWRDFLIKLILAILIMALTLIAALHYLPLNFSGRALYRGVSLLIVTVIATVSYFSSLYLLGFRVRHFIFHEVN